MRQLPSLPLVPLLLLALVALGSGAPGYAAQAPVAAPTPVAGPAPVAVATPAATPTPAASPGGNLLTNGDFEQSDGHGGAAAWSPYAVARNNSGTAGLTTPGYKSRQSAVITGLRTPAVFGLFSQPLDVTTLPGEELLLTCYYKTDGDPTAQVSLVGFPGSFLPQEWKAPYLQSETRRIPPTRDWALLSWRFRLVPGVRDLVTVFRVGGVGKLYLDQASLQAYPTAVSVEVTQAGVVDSPPARRLLEVKLTNRGEQAKNLQVTALALAVDRGPVQAIATTHLAAGQAGTVRLNYPYDYRASHTLRVIVQDADGTDTYEQQDVHVPGLISAHFVAPAYRDTLIDGLPTPKLIVEGVANVAPELRAQFQISAQLMSGGQNSVFEKADAPAGQFRLELPTPALVSGEHVVRVTARVGDQEQVLDLALHHLPPGPAQTGYDEQLRMWTGGKRLLPRGLYGVTTPEDVQLAAAAGFNFVIVPSARASYEVQTAATKAGVSVVVATATNSDDLWARLRQKWGDSPLTLGWLPYSRPDLHGVSPGETLLQYQDLCKSMPAVPVLLALASPSQAQYYTEGADVLLAWSLPVPRSPLRALGEMVRILGEDARGAKPVWAVVQAAGATSAEDLYVPAGKPGRVPTPAEMTALTYLGLLAGARGLVWYSLDISDYAGGAHYRLPADAPALWAALPSLNLQLRWLTPVLLEGTRERLPAVGAIEMARWRYQGGEYVIAVNGAEKGTVTPLTAFAPGAKVQVMFENREVDADPDGAIQDSFAPYGVHVYVVG